MMDKKNEIIEAEYREIGQDPEALSAVTAEINYITEQVNRTVLAGIIEIGKRFERAKSLVQYGKWGEYCERCTGYKQSMAENYIKVYKEYGSEQYSLFGDLSNSQSIRNLGITKLIELTAIPADEREEFVEKNNITEDTTVKELQTIIRQQKEKITEAEERAAESERKLADSIDKNQKIVSAKQSEIDRLSAELEHLNKEEHTIPENEMEKMAAQADERAKQTLKKEIDRLEAEKKKALNEAEKLQKKYDSLSKKYEKQSDEVRELTEKTEAAQKEKEELKQTISKLQKESMLGANEKLVKLNICFEDTQATLRNLKSALEEIKDSEDYEKLHAVVSRQITDIVQTL